MASDRLAEALSQARTGGGFYLLAGVPGRANVLRDVASWLASPAGLQAVLADADPEAVAAAMGGTAYIEYGIEGEDGKLMPTDAERPGAPMRAVIETQWRPGQ